MQPKITVIERKLGREKAHGQAWIEKNLIEIDERLDSRRYLLYIIHELLHLVFDNKLSEKDVKQKSSIMAKVVWSRGFRRLAK